MKKQAQSQMLTSVMRKILRVKKPSGVKKNRTTPQEQNPIPKNIHNA
jgi:hypothetical protein